MSHDLISFLDNNEVIVTNFVSRNKGPREGVEVYNWTAEDPVSDELRYCDDIII